MLQVSLLHGCDPAFSYATEGYLLIIELDFVLTLVITTCREDLVSFGEIKLPRVLKRCTQAVDRHFQKLLQVSNIDLFLVGRPLHQKEVQIELGGND